MVRHQSDVVRRDIRMSSGHPMAVGSDVRVGRVGWVTDILWILVCYQGNTLYENLKVGTANDVPSRKEPT